MQLLTNRPRQESELDTKLHPTVYCLGLNKGWHLVHTHVSTQICIHASLRFCVNFVTHNTVCLWESLPWMLSNCVCNSKVWVLMKVKVFLVYLLLWFLVCDARVRVYVCSCTRVCLRVCENQNNQNTHTYTGVGTALWEVTVLLPSALAIRHCNEDWYSHTYMQTHTTGTHSDSNNTH